MSGEHQTAWLYERRYGTTWKTEVSLEDPRVWLLDESRRNVRMLITCDGPDMRHVKRGSEYHVVGDASFQNASDHHLVEGDAVRVYRDAEDGKLWARYEPEFSDGRFEEVK